MSGSDKTFSDEWSLELQGVRQTWEKNGRGSRFVEGSARFRSKNPDDRPKYNNRF